MLIREKRAEKYTKKNYEAILEKLSNKKSGLFPGEGDAAEDKGPQIQTDFLNELDS